MATNSNVRDPRALGWPLYLLALLLIVGPLSEWLVVSWPMQPDVARWRFATVGLLGDRLTLPVIGLFAAVVAATLLEHRAAQATLAGLGLLAAPALVLLAGTIGLDGLQLRHTVRADVIWGFDRSLARTVVLLLFAAVVAAMIGQAGLRARGKKRSRAKHPALIPLREPLVRGRA